MQILWAAEVDNLRTMLNNGIVVKDIGEYYGVSHQRVYQVLTKFGLQTNVQKQKNKLRDLPPKYYWLNKMLRIKGFSFTDIEYLFDTMSMPGTCPVLGITLNYNGTGISGKYTAGCLDNSPSIDRINNTKGYTLDNIAIISWRANRLKGDGTAEEHRLISDWTRIKLEHLDLVRSL